MGRRRNKVRKFLGGRHGKLVKMSMLNIKKSQLFDKKGGETPINPDFETVAKINGGEGQGYHQAESLGHCPPARPTKYLLSSLILSLLNGVQLR